VRRFFPVCLLLGLCCAGCESIPSKADGGLPELMVESLEPSLVLPGTWIHVRGKGFVDENQGTLMVFLERGGDQRLVVPERLDDGHIKFQIGANLFTALGGPGSFMGTVRVQADYTGGQSQSHTTEVIWTLQETLQPRLDSFSATEGIVYLGSDVQGEGTGFLLEGEGETQLRLSGTFTPEGGASAPWSGSFAVPAGRRDLLDGPFPVEALGISPGVFAGDLTVVNVHADEREVLGNDLQGVAIELGRTFLLWVEPSEASPRQWIQFTGRGFVDGSADTGVRIEGTFTERGGSVTDLTGDNALEIFPDVISGDVMRYVLRVTPDGQGGVEGLGAVAGTLQGSATPVVYYGADSQVGFPLESMTLIVGPQKQVVYMNYLPGFTDALREFGLRNVESRIRDRILEVVNRDYRTDQPDGINIEWRTTRPDDFVEYSVIEIGGEDPNDVGLIGLDNTMSQGGKDIDNLYFDDVVGGLNAKAREEGHYAFGGVFVSSYLAFSPKAPNPMSLKSPVFDEIFGPFMPSQGGTPVEAGEYPGGARADKIGRAIHALGSMIGNTISHEIGHTLGLAVGPKDLFHNLVPLDNQIMDAGFNRDFEERAEQNGRGPARFTDENWDYLRRILPK
jgi:hypothetical protein